MLGNPSRGQPNIHDIASNGDVAQMEALLASNPDLMSEAEGGTLKTPLHLACERGDLELVALLLARGADTAARDRHQLTPLFAAVKRNAAKVVRLLLRSGGSQADPPPPPQGGNGGGGGEPTPQGRLSGWSTRPSHSTSTTTAVATPSASTPSSSPASDPNVVAKKGETPLLWAARFGKASVVRALLKAGADVHYCPGRQAGGVQLRTALHCAAASGREDLVRLLLAHGASLNVVDGEGKTPIFSAVKYDQGPVLEYLFSLPDINLLHRDSAGRSILHAASASGHLAIVKRLVELAPSLLEMKDRDGQTCLFSAAKYQRVDVLRFLAQEKSANVNVRDRRGRTPLHSACAGGAVLAIGLLLEMGALPNMQDDQGQSPLFSAIKYQKTEAVECLLKAGTRTVDVNLQDKAGMTALHHASKESYREGTEQLLCCERIDVNVADSRGKTPQDYVVDDTIRDLFVERITTEGTPSRKRKAVEGEEGASPPGSPSSSSSSAAITASSPSSSITVLPQQSTPRRPLPTSSSSPVLPAKSPPKKARASPHSTIGRTTVDTDAYDLSTVAYEPARRKSAGERPTGAGEQERDCDSISYDLALSFDGADGTPVGERRAHSQEKGKGMHIDEDDEDEDEDESELIQTARFTRVETSVRSISGESVNLSITEMLKVWEIKIDELKFGEALGTGAFGSVCKGTWRSSEVAIKRLHKQDDTALKMFFKEVQLMCKLRHGNIVQYFGVCLHPSARCLVMEYVPESLAGLLRHGPIDHSLLVMIAKGIAQGMHYLHCSNIIHRDLKPSNILLDNQWTPKLCDFGVSRESDATATMTGLGTPLYMAPEMLQTRHYGAKIDCYSFAMVLWQMCTGKKLMDGFGFDKDSVPPMRVAFKACYEKLRPIMPADCPPALADLIRACWEDAPEMRPSFQQILEKLSDLG